MNWKWGAVGSTAGVLMLILSAWLGTRSGSSVLAGLGVLVAGFFLPYWFIGSNTKYYIEKDDPKKTQHFVSPWYVLLSERHGGWSLGRVQLLIWYLSALAIYAAVSVPARAFATLDTDGFAVLLGLSGLTAAGAAVGSPPDDGDEDATDDGGGGGGGGGGESIDSKTAPSTYSEARQREEKKAAMGLQNPNPQGGQPAKAPEKKPDPNQVQKPNGRDLVEDWAEQPDVTRLQHLLLSIVGAIILVSAYLLGDRVKLPVVPEAFLYLVSGSQIAYVGTKLAKNAKEPKKLAQ